MPASAPLVLAIDTAGSACGAAVARGEELLAITNTAMVHGQAEALLPMIDEVVRQAQLTPAALDLVAVTTGPGSFTGIRVGIAAARGITLALGLPLMGVSSFEAAAASVADAALGGSPLLVALDSRRADLYVQLFDPCGPPLSQPAARLPETLAGILLAPRAPGVIVVGDGAERAVRAFAQGVEAMIVTAAPPVAGALRVALRQWRRGEPGGAVRAFYLRPPNVDAPGKEGSRDSS